MKKSSLFCGATVRIRKGARFSDGTRIPVRLVGSLQTVVSLKCDTALLFPLMRHIPLRHLVLLEDFKKA